MLVSLVSPAHAADFSEHEIKAAYLFNFAHFIRWPDSTFDESTSSFRICAMSAESPTVAILKKVIAGQKARGRAMIFYRVSEPDDLADCQILYLQVEQRAQFVDFLNAAAGHDVLTVSDDPNCADRGGMIALTRQGKRLLPTINVR